MKRRYPWKTSAPRIWTAGEDRRRFGEDSATSLTAANCGRPRRSTNGARSSAVVRDGVDGGDPRRPSGADLGGQDIQFGPVTGARLGRGRHGGDDQGDHLAVLGDLDR